jgi:hypothetical protein
VHRALAIAADAASLSFPHLPVLDALINRVSFDPATMADVKVVAVQHLLSTTGSLFEKIIQAGVPPSSIFVLGKPYSTHTMTAAQLGDLGVEVHAGLSGWRPGYYESWFCKQVIALWKNVASHLKQSDRIVILDDGGFCRRLVPLEIAERHRIVGIEQTTSGIRNESSVPVILVAASAAKIEIEPPFICAAVLRRAEMLSRPATGAIGVVGTGNVGTALIERLRYDGHDVLAFDRVFARTYSGPARPIRTLRDLAGSCGIIFGCAGEDIRLVPKFFNSGEQRMLVSCSSGDIEFRSLLRSLHSLDKTNPLDDLAPDEFSGSLIIRRGGFPANFDGSAESVPPDDIQLTRGLLFAAFLQACVISTIDVVPNRLMLDPQLQQLVVQQWAAARGGLAASASLTRVPAFEDIGTISARSAGTRILIASKEMHVQPH